MGLKCYIINTDIVAQNVGTDLVTTAKVYANITDDSGQPANGDGAIITYSIKENGVITDDETPAYGQSVLLFDGIIEKAREDSSGFTTYYSKSFGFLVITRAVDASPPVNYCDLVIDHVNVDKPESAPGAGDAQITIQASSSYLPLLYSLDNINFQTSKTFTGITGGLKTVYVKDANAIGCTASLSVTVAVMGRLLVSDPSVTINGNISRWNAAFNPVVFTYQRKDFEVIAVSADSLSGNAKLLINADLTSIITGDLVYINAGPYNGVYQANTTTGAGNTIVINTPYVAAATGFVNINRLRPYYKLLTKITYQDVITGAQTTIQSNNRPDNSGLIKADLSNFLQSLLQAKDESDYTKPNFRDANLSASYQIAYAEHWDDGTAAGHTSDWVTIADPYYVVYAAKQLGQRYGGNLAAYVPFINGEPQANWITDFIEPAYSNNYPFDIGFIYSEQMAGLQLYSKIKLLDINRNPLPGDTLDSYLLNDNGSWLLNQDGSKFLITRQAVSNSSITRQLGLNRFLIDTDFADDAYYLVIGLYHNGSAPATFNYQLTEATSPTFIDGNGQLKDNNVEVADIYSSGYGSHSIAAGNAYSFEAFVNETPADAVNPTMRFTITKDGTVIYDQRVTAVAGTSMFKRGIAQPGAIYDVAITTLDTTETITPVGIADDTPFTGAEVQVLKDQVIRIDKTVDDNSVYLRWIGLTGSWNYYRFVYNQEISLDVQNATIIKNFVSDWENQQGIEEVISKTAGQKMKVMAQDLSVADIKGLQSIKYSPKVQMLINKNPVKWQTVVLNTATFSEYETINGQAPFSVTFNLPSINIQTQ